MLIITQYLSRKEFPLKYAGFGTSKYNLIIYDVNRTVESNVAYTNYWECTSISG
jgi:hypothetical protein